MRDRLISAFVRAMLVAVLIAVPALILPQGAIYAPEMVLFLAIFAAVFTFVEYNAASPSIVEFRAAPPINRIRYVALGLSVLLLTLLLRHQLAPSGLTGLLAGFAAGLGELFDFPYSPVRLVLLTLPERAPPAYFQLVRMSAAVAFVICALSVALFYVMALSARWPKGGSKFNLWVNLPLFHADSKGDIVARLHRDARANLVLGALLPFLIPAVIRVGTLAFNPSGMLSPHAMLWTICAWAFLPASMIQRGIALGRIGEMIAEKRRREGGPAAQDRDFGD